MEKKNKKQTDSRFKTLSIIFQTQETWSVFSGFMASTNTLLSADTAIFLWKIPILPSAPAQYLAYMQNCTSCSSPRFVFFKQVLSFIYITGS